MISLSPNCFGGLALAASPFSLHRHRNATVSHDQQDFKSHNTVSTILLFLSLAVCICVLQSLLCVQPLLLSVGHRWTPPAIFNSKLFFWSTDNSHVEKSETSQSYSAETCGLVVWRYSTSTASFWPMFPFLNISCTFPYLSLHVLLHDVCRHL